MKKLISALIITSIIFSFSVQCFAQSSLLSLNTVVLLTAEEAANMPAPQVSSTAGNIRAPYVVGQKAYSTSPYFEVWNAAEKGTSYIKDVSSFGIYK